MRNRTTNKGAVLCHVITYQQLTFDHGKHQSLDRNLAHISVEAFCHTFLKIFTPKSFKPRSQKCDMVIGATSTARSDLLHGSLNPMTRQPNRQKWPNLFEDEKDELAMSNNSPTDHVVTALNKLPNILQHDKTHTRTLNTQVPNFRGSNYKFHELEHFPLKEFRAQQKRNKEKYKLHYFESLLRDEAIDFRQTLPITTENTMEDVLDKCRREFGKDDSKEVFRWDQLAHDPTKENFSDFLKTLIKTGTQAFGDRAAQFMENVPFRKFAITDTTQALGSRQVRREHGRE